VLGDGLFPDQPIRATKEALDGNTAGFRQVAAAPRDGAGEIVNTPPPPDGRIDPLTGKLKLVVNDDSLSGMDPLITTAFLNDALCGTLTGAPMTEVET
jgi:hypothetical protein